MNCYAGPRESDRLIGFGMPYASTTRTGNPSQAYKETQMQREVTQYHLDSAQSHLSNRTPLNIKY